MLPGANTLYYNRTSRTLHGKARIPTTMRPVSARDTADRQRSTRLQIKTGNRGLYRGTEPVDADMQMASFLEHGIVPTLSFKASREKVQATLCRPLQAVKTDLMGIATSILDRIAKTWGCLEQLVNETRGERIDRLEAEEFIARYLKYHSIPGKLQVRWVKRLNSGGKLQEIGPRGEPTGRRLRLWISSGFAGANYSRSITGFADHEICTHAVRAINDHAQVRVCLAFPQRHANVLNGALRQNTEYDCESVDTSIMYRRLCGAGMFSTDTYVCSSITRISIRGL